MDSHRRLCHEEEQISFKEAERIVSFLLALIISLLVGSLLGCDSGSVTGPTSVPSTPPPVIQLQAPTLLRGRWAEGGQVTSLPPEDNIAILLPSYANDKPAEIAEALAKRHLPVIVFCEFIFGGPREQWESSWAYFESAYLVHFRERGLLVGAQPLDEPASHDKWNLVEPAVKFVRSKGLRVFLTEVVIYVDESGYFGRTKIPSGVDWFGPVCYDFQPSRWTLENCAQEHREHPEWNTVIGQGFDAGRGLPDPKAWERIAAGPPAKGLIWWDPRWTGYNSRSEMVTWRLSEERP